MTAKQIRADLRAMAKLNHGISTAVMLDAQRRARLHYLQKRGDAAEDCAKLTELLIRDDPEKLIHQERELQDRYEDLIDRLDDIDRTIFRQAFYLGRNYYKIGLSVGYSEIGIRKRIDKGVKRLAELSATHEIRKP